MDMIKTGAFIAELRHQRGLTQQQLGELVGATNKTVSRWETGTYMPPIESLEALSKELGVTVNELIAGERLSEPEFREKADENVRNAWQDSAFTLKERQEYFARRWRRRYLPAVIVGVLLYDAVLVLLVFSGLVRAAAVTAFAVLPSPFIAAVVNNAMMSYAERRTFDIKEEKE